MAAVSLSPTPSYVRGTDKDEKEPEKRPIASKESVEKVQKDYDRQNWAPLEGVCSIPPHLKDDFQKIDAIGEGLVAADASRAKDYSRFTAVRGGVTGYLKYEDGKFTAKKEFSKAPDLADNKALQELCQTCLQMIPDDSYRRHPVRFTVGLFTHKSETPDDLQLHVDGVGDHLFTFNLGRDGVEGGDFHIASPDARKPEVELTPKNMLDGYVVNNRKHWQHGAKKITKVPPGSARKVLVIAIDKETRMFQPKYPGNPYLELLTRKG